MNIDIDTSRSQKGQLLMKPEGSIDAKTSPALEAAMEKVLNGTMPEGAPK